MPRELRYQALVSAKTREEAVEVASEALPSAATITRFDAENVADREGADSWLVTLWFVGEARDGPS